MAPPSSISWICCRTSSTNGGAMQQNLSLNGSWSSSSISCSVTFVHPISWGSREKMSWYSSNSLVARVASLGGHDLSHSRPPSFSRAAISSLCLSSTGLGWRFRLQFLQQLWGGRCIRHCIGCQDKGNCLTSGEMDGPGCHVPDYDGDLATAGFHVCIHSRNVNPIW